MVQLFGSYDDRPLVVQTVDLFDQRTLPAGSYPDWKGDWIFRRERLAVVDQALRSDKPDILLLQSNMARVGSPSESDTAILNAGALVGFDIIEYTDRLFDDTNEESKVAVAASLPIRIKRPEASGVRRQWALGDDGLLALTLLQSEGQILSVFNVKMPSEASTRGEWYKFMFEKVFDHFRYSGNCMDRVIIAGYLPFRQGDEQLERMFELLNLKDVAEEVCELNRACYTRSLNNSLSRVLNPGLSEGRVDRILVGADVIVDGSRRAFTQIGQESDYLQRWELKRTEASVRYGWTANLRFPKCQ